MAKVTGEVFLCNTHVVSSFYAVFTVTSLSESAGRVRATE
jgi:hypothetical protein